MKRSYTELLKFSTLLDRFNYLRLDGEVGQQTFGSRRSLNQSFYTSHEWRQVRHFIIFRDNGCDLGVEGFNIYRDPVVHHLNPLTENDIRFRSSARLDPENLILTTHDTHNAIHYGDERLLPQPFIERRPGDTKEW